MQVWSPGETLDNAIRGKHSYFEHLAQSMGNFINIEFSLATHHQLLQCCILTRLPSKEASLLLDQVNIMHVVA